MIHIHCLCTSDSDSDSCRMLKLYKNESAVIYLTFSVSELLESVRNVEKADIVLVDNSMEDLEELGFLVDLIALFGPELEMLLFNASSNVARLALHEQSHLARFYSGELEASLIDQFIQNRVEEREAFSALTFENTHEYPIFVLEDENSLREVLLEYLGMQGFQVQFLDSIQKLKNLRYEKKCLLLIDLQFPGLDPLQFFSKEELPENAIILGLTSMKQKEQEQRLLKMGIHAVINKPIPLAKLSNLLDRLGQLDPTNRERKASKLKKRRKKKRRARTIILSLTVAVIFTLLLGLIMQLSLVDEKKAPESGNQFPKNSYPTQEEASKAYQEYLNQRK